MVYQSLMVKGNSVAVKQISCSKVVDLMPHSDFADDAGIWRLVKNTRRLL